MPFSRADSGVFSGSNDLKRSTGFLTFSTSLGLPYNSNAIAPSASKAISPTRIRFFLREAKLDAVLDELNFDERHTTLKKRVNHILLHTIRKK
mmetsp:Transcript_17435/g.26147  ORF Transcript_17435/g.26147 Transcript_17435/m.26147 type:complete len:93 (-) Transcript_17435:42-320(-)